MEDDKLPRPEEAPRPATREDLIDLCRELNRVGARYMVIGGWAVNQYGLIRATTDIDFLVDASERNVRRLKEALSTLPDNAAAEILDDEIARYVVVRVNDEVTVDLMLRSATSLSTQVMWLRLRLTV